MRSFARCRYPSDAPAQPKNDMAGTGCPVPAIFIASSYGAAGSQLCPADPNVQTLLAFTCVSMVPRSAFSR